MNWPKLIPAVALLLGSGMLVGCASSSGVERPSDPVALSAPTPETPEVATPPASRPRPVFLSAPQSFDPLAGPTHSPVFSADPLDVLATCCPIHRQKQGQMESFDPLLD